MTLNGNYTVSQNTVVFRSPPRKFELLPQCRITQSLYNSTAFLQIGLKEKQNSSGL